MRKNDFTCLLALASLLAWTASSGCAGLYREGPDTRTHTDPVGVMVEFYRGPLNRCRAVRTGACPMHPSCSEYSRQAIATHGPLLGWIMTCDRLMRCGRDEVKLSGRIWIDGDTRIFDPLEANDFWLGGHGPAAAETRPAEETAGCGTE